jgi:hypothetical protein
MKKERITLIVSEPTIIHAFLKETHIESIRSGSLIILKREKDLQNFIITKRTFKGHALRGT